MSIVTARLMKNAHPAVRGVSGFGGVLIIYARWRASDARMEQRRNPASSACASLGGIDLMLHPPACRLVSARKKTSRQRQRPLVRQIQRMHIAGIARLA